MANPNDDDVNVTLERDPGKGPVAPEFPLGGTGAATGSKAKSTQPKGTARTTEGLGHVTVQRHSSSKKRTVRGNTSTEDAAAWFLEKQQQLQQQYTQMLREQRLAQVKQNLQFEDDSPIREEGYRLSQTPSEEGSESNDKSEHEESMPHAASLIKSQARERSYHTHQSSPPQPDEELEKPYQPKRRAAEDLITPYKPAALLKHSKFTSRIARAQIPPKMKMPHNLGKYDGKTDPDDFLQGFYTAGGLEQWTMPVWCHMFAQCLTGAARVWFESLPTGGIDSIEELTEKFMEHFNQQRRHTRDPEDIIHCVRKSNEDLEDYITRFNQEALAIGGITEQLLRVAFLQGARSDDLRRVLVTKEGMPTKWSKVMEAARVYARNERLIA